MENKPDKILGGNYYVKCHVDDKLKTDIVRLKDFSVDPEKGVYIPLGVTQLACDATNAMFVDAKEEFIYAMMQDNEFNVFNILYSKLEELKRLESQIETFQSILKQKGDPEFKRIITMNLAVLLVDFSVRQKELRGESITDADKEALRLIRTTPMRVANVESNSASGKIVLQFDKK